MLDRIYNYFIYRKIMHDLEKVELSIIDSEGWYDNRLIYRQCIELEISVDTMYKSGFDNLLLAHILMQVDKLQHGVRHDK